MKAVNNYLKNVMKSVTYAASDVFSEYTPGMHEFTSSNKEFATATYATLKNPAMAVRKSVDAIQQSKVYKALDYGAKNLVEDLRTGNFYNKERKERDELALSGLDANWDDLSEYGISDDWKESSSSSESSDGGVSAGDMKIVQSIEGSNAAVASATVNAVLATSHNEIKANRANMGMLYTQNERLFGGLHKDITVLGATMNEIYKLQAASLQNIDKNMSSFFTSESKLSAERNAILKEMLEMQRNQYKSAADKEKEAAGKRSGRIRWNDINVNGMVNLEGYFGLVKKNINSQISSLGLGGFGEDSNMLAEFMVSPLEGAMKYVVNGVIPATVKAATKEFDSTISGVFGNIIGELGNARSNNSGGILGMLAKFLGVNTGVNRNIDTSRYEKGPIPFDGITRKAIIDVIPTHLRRIEAAITGRPEEMFDYKAGRWVRVSSLKTQFEDIKKNAIRSATAELRSAMNSGVKKVKGGIQNKNDQESFDKAVEEFYEFLYDNNGRFNPNATASKNGISSATYPNLYRHFSKIKTIFSGFDYIEEKDDRGNVLRGRNTRNGIRMQLSNSVLNAKDNEEKQYRDIESSVGNVLNSYFGSPKGDTHGKYDSKGKFTAFNNLNSTKDNLGNTIFDYLQNINRELTWFRMNGIPGGAGSGRGQSRRRSKYTHGVDINNIDLRNASMNSTRDITNRIAEDDRIRRSALTAITSGKAIDLRDFDVDEQSYLLQLQAMMSNDATVEYQNEIKGYNSNAISKFMDKHFIKTNIKSLKDVQKAIEKADAEGRNTNEVNMDAKEEKFFKKIMNRIGAGESILGGIVGASGEIFTNLLYAADKSIYEMMYKTEIASDGKMKKKYNGFMEAMVGKMSDTFDMVTDKLTKNIIDPLKERLGIDDDFKGRFKKGLINTGSKIWTSFKDANAAVYGPAYHEAMRAMGLEEGETIAQRQRAAKRKGINDKVKQAKSANNLLDNNFIALLQEYGLSFADYSNIDEAMTDLMPLLAKDMYKQSNKLKDKGTNLNDIKFAMQYAKTDKSALQKIAKDNGINIDNLSDNELESTIESKLTDRYYKSTRRTRESALASRSKDSSSVSSEYLEGLGFTGSIEDKKKMLEELGAKYGKTFTEEHLSRLDDDEKLGKAYLRLLEANNAKGTTGKPFSGLTTLTKGEGLVNKSGFSTVPKTGVYNVTTPTHIINTEDMHSITGGPRVSVQQALGKEKLAAKAAGFGLANHADGTIKITNKGVNVDPKVVMEEAKKYIPEAAGGGLIGGILSMVLGLAGGPLLGAAIGAGGSILSNSETLKKKLFGKLGEDGKRDGSGVINKNIVNALNKYLPDMTKFGLAGIIPGLITPLGPIGGLMAGAAIGFLKNNEKFTTKYFGEEGALHIRSKEKKIIQDMLPGALKGAGIGALSGFLFGGPFGLVGNAAIGTAIGLMTSTEEFKNGILGQEINGVRVGGILDVIKDTFAPLTDSMKDLGTKLIETFDKNIIDPISRFITPAIHAIPQLASYIPRKINEHIENTFGRSFQGMLKDFFVTPAQKAFNKIVAPVTKGIMNVVTSPVRLLGKAGDAIRERQIATGNADYMTARERVEWLKEHGKGNKISGIDSFLSDIGTENMSIDQAKSIYDNIFAMNASKSAVTSQKKKQQKKLNSIIDNYTTADGKSLSKKAKDSLRKAFESGDMQSIRKILSTYSVNGGDTGLSEAQINSLMDGDTGLGAEIKKYSDIKNREHRLNTMTDDDRDQANAAIKEALKKAGVDPEKINDKRFMAKFAKNLETEIYDREANSTEEAAKELALDTENNEIFKNMATNLAIIAERYKRAAIGDDQVVKDLGLKNSEDYDKAMDDMHADYANRNSKVRAAIGDDYDDYGDPVKEELQSKSKNIIGKKATRDNKNIALIRKYNIPKDYVNAANGKVTRLADIMREGYKRIDTKAIAKINSLTKTNFDKVIKFLSKAAIKKMLSYRAINENDISFFIDNFTRLNLVKNKCNYVLKNGSDPKDFSSFDEVMKYEGRRSAAESVTPVPEGNDSDVEQHGIGTIISGLFGAGKSIIVGASSILGSLFGGKKEEQSTGGKGIGASAIGALSTLFSGANKQHTFLPTGGGSVDNFDETDKPGDGKDAVHVGNGQVIQVTRDSSGNIEPDTTDSHTKQVLNDLSLKERVQSKLQEAQFKACELIKNTFDTSDMKESKGGKLGWLSLLFLGGLLAKSGILKKLYEGVIKPVWTDHVKPWITDKALPWIKGVWSNHVQPFILDKAIPAIGDLFGKAIGVLITQLPTLIWNGIKGIGKVAGTALDTVTGNKYNAGHVTTVDGKELGDEETGMYNEFGKKLTGEDIANGNFNKIYNAQGIEGTVNKDGKVSFKDDSIRGASYATTTGNAALHGFAKSMATGRVDLLTKASTGVSEFLSKRKGLIPKATGLVGNALTKPVEWMENAGIKVRNGFVSNLVDKASERILSKSTGSAAKDAANAFLVAGGDGSKTSKIIQKVADFTDNGIVGRTTDFVKNIAAKSKSKITGALDKAKGIFTSAGKESAEKTAQNVVKEAVEAGTESAIKEAAEEGTKKVMKESAESIAKETVETAAKSTAKAASGNKGMLAKILAKAKAAIDGLFANSKIQKKLAAMATSLGHSSVAKWIEGFKNSITSIFDDALEAGIKKVGSETVKKVLSKALTLVFLVTDFLTGCDQAESILGVTETTIAEEVVAGLLNSLCNFLIIPSIVPGVNWIARKIYALFDKDFSERQEEALKEYNDYIKRTGSTLTEEEWLKRQNSVTGAVGGWISDRGRDIKNGAKAIGNGIVKGAKAVGNGVVSGAKAVGGAVKNGVKAVGDAASGAWKGFTGLFGFANGTLDLKEYLHNNQILNNLQGFLVSHSPSAILRRDANAIIGMKDAALNNINEFKNDPKAYIKDKSLALLNASPQAKVFNAIKNSELGGLIGSKINNVKEFGSDIGDRFNNSTVGKIISSVKDGTTDKLSSLKEKMDSNPAVNAISKTAKVMLTPLNMLRASFNDIYEMLSDTSKDIEDTSDVYNVIQRTKDGRISIFSRDYWRLGGGKETDTSLAGTMKNAFNMLTRLINFPTFMIKNSLEALTKDITEVGNAMSGNSGTVSVSAGSESGNTTSVTKGTSFLGKAKNVFTSAVGKIKTFFGFGSGPASYQYGTGLYSKQIDPSVSGIRFNSSSDSEYQTIGNSGCGPAAAVNAIESMYGRGNAVVDAAKFALNHGYKETNGGTKPGFFTDYFNRNGLGSQTTYNRSQIERNINSGMPTVIMGKDANGTSSSTPFGKTPHYVTVTGTDGKGNAIVQDPESKYDNQLYPVRKLMKNTSLGISAFGKKYRPKKFGMGKYGRGKSTIIFIGDSRTVGMQSAVGSNNHIWSCKVSMGLSWMKSTGVPNIESQINSNTAVVILMGVNDCGNPSSAASGYSSYINGKATEWKGKGADVYFVSVNPVDENKYHGQPNNATIEEFNSAMKSSLQNVGYIDTYSQIKSSFSASDGLHYNNETYKNIYNIIVNAVTNGVTSTNTTLGNNTVTSTGSLADNSAQTSKNVNTIGGLFSSILINSKAGQALYSLLGQTGNNSSNTSQQATTGTTNVSGSMSTGSGGSFPKYNLNEAQIKGVANILQHEQPGLSGMLAEASLMANLTDIGGNENATPEKLVAKATGGWFAHGKDRFYNPGSPGSDAIKAAKAVMLNGKRTVPRYVNEHDCFSDLSSVTTDGSANSIRNRSSYVPFKTKIKNRYGSSYTFYGFPNDKADPFGYTSDSARQKWGDDHYSVDDAVAGLGKYGLGARRHKTGKWGRGSRAAEVWWYLRQMGLTEAGAAGLMGNLEAESGIDPGNCENLLNGKLGMSDEAYTSAVDSGSITKEQFLHPMGGNTQYGYGLAQWTSPGRKEGLYDAVKSKNVSISDLGTQLDHLKKELESDYSSVNNVLKTTNSVQEASDVVLTKFEIPKDQSQAVKNARATNGNKWYTQFTGKEGQPISGVTGLTGTSDNATSNNASEANNTIFNLFSNILAQSKAGQALNSLLGVTSNGSTSFDGGNNTNGGTTASGDAASVVQIAKNEIGTKEAKTNEVKYNDWYYGKHVVGDAYPWCAAFVSWVANQAGVSTDVIPKDAYTVTAYQTLVKRGGKISNSEARPGDIIYFTKNGGPSGIYHTGIVTGNENNKITTVEGNTSNMVAERNYETNSGKVLVARPQYKNTSSATTISTGSISTGSVSSAPDEANTRGGNGVKPLSRFGQFRDSIHGKGTTNSIMHRTRDGYVRVEHSPIDKQLGTAIKSGSRKTVHSTPRVGMGSVQNVPVFGMAGSPDYSKLINSIITILMTIADNTDKLNTIVTILNDKLNLDITASDVNNATGNRETLKSKLASTLNGMNSSTSKFNTYADNIGDNSLNSIIAAMNAIASE